MILSEDPEVETLKTFDGLKIGTTGKLTEEVVEQMAPLSNEESAVLVDVAIKNKTYVKNI